MTIRISDSVLDLTGQGIEYLTDSEGNPIAEFYDGNFIRPVSAGNNEVTI